MSHFPTEMRVVLLLLLLVGCGGQTQDDAQSQGSNQLHIPLEPVTQIAHGFTLDEVVDAGGGRATMLLGSRKVTLALGDEYPSAVDIDIGNQGYGCVAPSGDWEITGVSGGGDVVEPAQTGATSLRLERGVEGDAIVEVTGRFVPSDELVRDECWSEYEQYSEFEFEVDFQVSTPRVAGIKVRMNQSCAYTTEPLFFPGSSLRWMSVVPLDATGEELRLSNASGSKPVSLTLTAPPGAELKMVEEDKGLSGVELPQVKGVVEVAAHVGQSHHIEVVEPSQITSIAMYFNLRGISLYPIELETGKTYGEDGYYSDDRRIIPSFGVAYVDEVQVCSKPPGELFELTSLTPDTCPVEQGVGGIPKGGLNLTGSMMSTSAPLLEDGVCELRIHAPTLDHGEGLGAELKAMFVNVRSTD